VSEEDNMNIFVLHKDTRKAAQMHCDKHVVKMILESAQMLSTAVRMNGIDAGYKLTHRNHPCNIWVRESLSNWQWLKSLACELNTEWQFRYNHVSRGMSSVHFQNRTLKMLV
jgi:aspartate oxidase